MKNLLKELKYKNTKWKNKEKSKINLLQKQEINNFIKKITFFGKNSENLRKIWYNTLHKET